MENKIKLKLPSNIDLNEFKKCIPFISQDIDRFVINDNYLLLFLKNKEVSDKVLEKAEEMVNSFIHPVKKVTLYNYCSSKRIFNENVIDNINIRRLTESSLSFHNKATKLYDFFDLKFKEIALNLGAETEHYPTMLPLEKYKKTGYLKTSPQYSIFCCNAIEDMTLINNLQNSSPNVLSSLLSEPQTALSPAACFHTYCCHENQILEKEKIYTFNQSVFRNEGRFNWNDFGRLKDYHVREIVFVGSEDFVLSKRKEVMNVVIAFLKEIMIDSSILVANDPFILPQMQKYKKIQIKEQSKFELLLKYSFNKSIAAASFNFHGSAFTFPFNIKISNIDKPVTGCVGFGLERWVLAFVAQFGWDVRKWPKNIQDYLEKE